MRIQESSEDYLEAILMLRLEKGTVRAIDIANHMNFSKPTISIALKKLREKGYVRVDDSGNVLLTDEGRLIAEKTYEKHNLIAGILIKLGVEENTAFEDSCHIEHCLSDESFQAIKSFVKNNYPDIPVQE